MADSSPCCGTGRHGRSMFRTGYVALDEFPVLGLSEYFSRTLDKCAVRKAVSLKLIHHPCRQVSDVSVDAISAQYLGDPEVSRELTASTSPPRCGEQRGPHCGSRALFRCCLGSEVRGDARSGTDGNSTTPARSCSRNRNPDGPIPHEIRCGIHRTRRRVPRPMPRSERELRSRARRPQRERY